MGRIGGAQQGRGETVTIGLIGQMGRIGGAFLSVRRKERVVAVFKSEKKPERRTYSALNFNMSFSPRLRRPNSLLTVASNACAAMRLRPLTRTKRDTTKDDEGEEFISPNSG